MLNMRDLIRPGVGLELLWARCCGLCGVISMRGPTEVWAFLCFASSIGRVPIVPIAPIASGCHGAPARAPRGRPARYSFPVTRAHKRAPFPRCRRAGLWQDVRSFGSVGVLKSVGSWRISVEADGAKCNGEGAGRSQWKRLSGSMDAKPVGLRFA